MYLFVTINKKNPISKRGLSSKHILGQKSCIIF